MTAKNQNMIFAQGEGDQWYYRNRDNNWIVPIILNFLEGEVEPEWVVDYGCSDGKLLRALRAKHGCGGTGIDASSHAIDAAEQECPDIEWYRDCLGSHALHVGIEGDLVIASFILHWVSRNSILVALDTLYKSCDPGGHILIVDYQGECPSERPYRHVDGVKTYRAFYADAFLDLGLCDLVAFEEHFKKNPDEHFTLHLLRKRDL